MPPARDGLRPELMDQPGLSLAETERALADLERVNRWLFGIGATLRTMLPLLAAGPPRQSVLDLGTGSGQVPEVLARKARRRGVELTVVGIDRKLSHLVIGRRRRPRQLRVVAQARALPFRDGAVDWSLSNLFFHHFEHAGNRLVLAEMRRVARRGAVVVDLRRSRLAPFVVPLLLTLVGTARVARYDGRLSVHQAWDLDEVEALVAAAPTWGLPAQLRRRFPFRFSLVLPGAG